MQGKYAALAGLPNHSSVVERNTHTQRRVCQDCYVLHQAEVQVRARPHQPAMGAPPPCNPPPNTHSPPLAPTKVGKQCKKLARLMGVVHETHLLGAGVPLHEPVLHHLMTPAKAGGEDGVSEKSAARNPPRPSTAPARGRGGRRNVRAVTPRHRPGAHEIYLTSSLII